MSYASSCCSSCPHLAVYPDDLDKRWTAQPIWRLYDTGKFQKNKARFRLMSELQVTVLLLFILGCQRVPARLPEQYGLRLATAQLHGGRSWGEYAPGGTNPPGLLWWITEVLVLIVDSKRTERHCCAAAQHAGPRETDCMSAHFRQFTLKHKMFLFADWRWKEKEERNSKTL